MAAPGESFPQQFAQAILQLRQAKVQKDADLSEMRNDRAARNFLDQQKIALAEQQQAQVAAGQQDTHAFNMAKLQTDSADRQFAIEARVAFETENLKLQRDGMTTKAVSDLSPEGKGTAFLPYTSVGDAQKFRESWNSQNAGASGTSGAYQLFEHEIPGQGIVFQRVGGPGNEKLALDLKKTAAEIETEKQNRVLKVAQAELADARAENIENTAKVLEGQVSEDGANYAQKVIESKQDIARSQLAALSIKNDPQSKRLFAEITLDWKAYFKNDQKTLDIITVAETMQDSYLRAQAKGAVPKQTNPEAVKRSGAQDIITDIMVEGRDAELKAQATTAAGNTVVGKVHGLGPSGSFAITASGAQVHLSRGTQMGQPVAALGANATKQASDEAATIAEHRKVLRAVKAGQLDINSPQAKQAAAAIREHLKAGAAQTFWRDETITDRSAWRD